MDKLLNLFVSIVSQPSILVSLIALLGLVLQKKKFSEVIQGTIKTFVGFLVLIGGAGLISNSLTPFASMFQTALHTQGVVPSNEAVVAIALQQYGTPTALIMLVGMIVNILLARFTDINSFSYRSSNALCFLSNSSHFSKRGVYCKFVDDLIRRGLRRNTINYYACSLSTVYEEHHWKQSSCVRHTGNIGYASSGWIGKFWKQRPFYRGHKDS